MDISKVAARASLPIGGAITYQPIQAGLAVGVRMGKNGPAWHARRLDPTEKKLRYVRLPAIELLTPSEQFDAAASAARKWAGSIVPGASTTTIADVMNEYLTEKDASKADRKVAARLVLNDPIANVLLSKLNEQVFADWVERRKTCERRGCTTPSPASLQREAAILKAALHLGIKNRRIVSDETWAKPLALDPKVTVRRELYLDRDERKRLLDAMPTDEGRAFFSVLNMVPLRPGSLALADIVDWNSRTLELIVKHDKAHAGRKIQVHPRTADILNKAIGTRTEGPLLLDERGERWLSSYWAAQCRLAASKAGLQVKVVAYTLRHSGITDLIVGGIDPLTTARIAGTSVQMIQDHYGHLVNSQGALAVLAA